jgi:hypothetical protein
MAGTAPFETTLFGWPPFAATSTRTVFGVHEDAPAQVSRQKLPGTTFSLGVLVVAQD